MEVVVEKRVRRQRVSLGNYAEAKTGFSSESEGEEEEEDEGEEADFEIAFKKKRATPSKGRKRKNLDGDSESDADDNADRTRDGEEGGEDEDKEDGEKEPKPRKRAAKRGGAANAAGREASFTQKNWLFAALNSSGRGANPSTLLSDWLDMCKKRREDAMHDLIELLLLSAGFNYSDENMTSNSKMLGGDSETTGSLRSCLFDTDLITEFVDTLNHEVNQENGLHVPDTYMFGKKTGKKFQSNFMEFFALLGATAAKESFLLADNESEEAFTLINWLGALSSCIFRPFRHTATLAALSIMNGMAEDYASIGEEITALSSKKDSTRANKSGTAAVRIAALQKQKARMEVLMNENYNAIFVHRYRDTDPHIRQDCIKILADTMQKCPEIFLDSQYLRYMGWVLSDKVAAVRSESLHSLSILFKPADAAGLRPFIERFKQRIIDMAKTEKELALRLESVKALVATNELGFLEDGDFKQILHLAADPDMKLRSALAETIRDWSVDEYSDPLNERIEGDTRYLALDWDKMVQVKVLAQVLVNVCNAHAERKSLISTKDLQMVSDTFSANDAFESIVCKANPEYEASCKSSWSLISEWISQDEAYADPGAVDSVVVRFTVSAFTDHFDVLAEFNAMCDFLQKDFTGSDPSPFMMREEEESAVIFALTASIILSLTKKSGSKAERNQMAEKANRAMAKHLPALLSKYAKDFSAVGIARLRELVAVINSLDLNVFVELGMSESFEKILSEVEEIFKTHQSPVFLREISFTLQSLCGNTLPSLPLNDDELTDNDENSLLRLREMAQNTCESLATDILNSISTSLPEMLDACKNDGLSDNEDVAALEGFVSNVTRLHEFSNRIALFRMKAMESFEEDFFQMMNNCIDIVLQTLKVNQESPTQVSAKFILICTNLMEASIGLLVRKTSYNAFNLQQNPAPENIPSIASNFKRLHDFCEAVVADWEGKIFGVEFPLTMRSICLKAMAVQLPLFDGIESIDPSLSRNLTPNFKTQSFCIIAKLVQLAVFEFPRFPQTKGQSYSYSECQQRAFSSYVDTLNFDVQRLLCTRDSVADCNFGEILTYYGFEDASFPDIFSFYLIHGSVLPSKPSRFTILGSGWNLTCEKAAKVLFASIPENIELLSKRSHSAECIDVIQDQLKAIFRMVSKSVQNSIDLYLQRCVPDLSQAENLVSCIVDNLKLWTEDLGISHLLKKNDAIDYLTNLQETIQSAVLTFIEDALQTFGRRVQDWHVMRDEADNVDISFQLPDNSLYPRVESEVWQGAKHVVGNLESVNSAWGLWGTIAGVCNKLLDSIGIPYNVDDVIGNVEAYLTSIDLKPVESEEVWNDYFSCLEQLRTGSLSGGIKKVKKMVAARSKKPVKKARKAKPAPSSSPVKGTRKSTRRISKLGAIKETLFEEEEEEEEEGDEEKEDKQLEDEKSVDTIKETATPTKKKRAVDSEATPPVEEFQDSPIMMNMNKRVRL